LKLDSLPLLSTRNLAKKYGKTVAIDQLSITVQRGEVFGLLGPSGCGKTTALRLMLGLETPDSGLVEFADRDITEVPPGARGFGMVFQNYALFTHLNVFENIAFGLKAPSRGGTAAAIREQVENMLALVRLPAELASRKVDQLSAGQQQRVAIERALAIQPPLVLLDEPLAHLDAGLRRRTGDEIRAMIRHLNVAAIFVTHDQSEAFTLCDRIAVMNNGRILQTGSPSDVYQQPSEPFVAHFLGFNVVPARRVGSITDAVSELEILGGGWRLQVRECLDTAGLKHERCMIAIRPEDIHIETEKRGLGNCMPATIRQVVFAGPTRRLKLDVGGVVLETLIMRGSEFSPGDDCVIEIPPDGPRVFAEKSGSGSSYALW
jgi:ABC-type Fe3+/spermidine/putrescine transport system ATPase subunit